MKARYVGNKLGVDADLVAEVGRVAKWLLAHNQALDLAGNPDEAGAQGRAFGIVNRSDYDPGDYPDEDVTPVAVKTERIEPARVIPVKHLDPLGQITWIPAVKLDDEKGAQSAAIRDELKRLQDRAWLLKQQYIALNK